MNAYEKMTLFPNVVNVVVWLKYKERNIQLSRTVTVHVYEWRCRDGHNMSESKHFSKNNCSHRNRQ